MLTQLPRLVLAAHSAPAGTPVLVDAGLPDLHRTALALCLPDHPLHPVALGSLVQVDQLHAALIGDLGNLTLVRDDMVALPLLRAVTSDAPPVGARVLLWSADTARTLRNAASLRAALDAQGCVALDPAALSLPDRIAALSQARDVILADPALMADALLAQAGARVFPLLPAGSDLHLGALAGDLAGQKVTAILGSAPYRRLRTRFVPWNRARVFHVDPHLILPFLPAPDPAPQALTLRAALDQLYGAAFQADVLTGAWAVQAEATPAGFDARLRHLRAIAADGLMTAQDADIVALFDHPFFADFARAIRSGFPVLGDFTMAEADLATRVRAAFAERAFAAQAQAVPDPAFAGPDGAYRLVLLGMLLLPAWQVPLPTPDLPEPVLERWTQWAMVPPALIRTGEDKAWVAHVRALLGWLANRLAQDDLSAALRLRLARQAGRIDLGQLLLIDQPLRRVQAARNRVLAQVALHEGRDQGAAVPTPTPSRLLHLRETLGFYYERLRLYLGAGIRAGDLHIRLAALARRALQVARNRVLGLVALRGGGMCARTGGRGGASGARRIRIGLLCRTFDKGPDSEAVLSFFRGFDQSRYEIFVYSIGFRDRVVSKDPAFDRLFDATIPHRRSLPADPAGIRAMLRADALDVFLYANATTYGLQPLDLALFHRIAPLQIVLNSHVPMPMGYPSFDAVITGQSDDPAHDVDQTDYAERLIRLPGPVINYLTTLEPRPNPPLDRAALGLDEGDIVLMNAGSSMKLRHATLATMMRAVRDIPRGVLLLAPYNPGWAARSMAFVFNRQIAETAAEVGLDPARIRILGELSVAEAEAALACADLYLNPFPHGGATMTHLALIHGVPPVTLRRRSTRSIDQFLIETHGFAELLANTPEDYVALAQTLATNPARRADIRARLKEAAQNPGFVANPTYSHIMQAAIDRLVSQMPTEG